MTTKCGFVSILGLPNAGKSTLVNALVGTKVSIVSKKVQTTRCRVLGIAMEGDTQIVLMDTPGIFSPEKRLDRAMVGAAWDTLDKADAVVHLIDSGTKKSIENNEIIISRLPKDKPCLLVLNKTDQVKKPELLELAAEYNKRFNYHATFMISALKKEGIEDISKALSGHMPGGDFMFDPEQITDIPMRFMAAEITREKVFHQLHEELPYAIMVETEQWENFDNGDYRISQVIYVQRETQKAIVVGRGGSRIRELGAAARTEMEEAFGAKVHLKLFVKVQENWPERAESLAIIGLGT